MSKELYSQIIGPLNKGVNQQADSFVLPGFAKVLENANCDLVEGLKKRLGLCLSNVLIRLLKTKVVTP